MNLENYVEYVVKNCFRGLHLLFSENIRRIICLFNERQRKLLNMQFDGFNNDLIVKGVLQKTNEGGRSTNYILVDYNS